jgi:hypothetical protein
MGRQLVQLTRPEVAIAIQPGLGLGERDGLQPAMHLAPLLVARDKPCTIQHGEVLGDGGSRDPERSGELGNRGFSAGQPIEDRPPGGIRESRERVVEARG